MRKLKATFWLSVLAITLFAVVAGAQTIDGTLRGEVSDPSGAVVAGAKVTATNVGTNISRDTVTTSSGTFTFPNVLPGTYTVTVETSGFAKYTREQVQVRTNQVTEVNPRLAVAGATAEVDVVTGADVNPAEVLTSLQKADLSFRMMMQVRNKLIQAYQEIKDIRI